MRSGHKNDSVENYNNKNQNEGRVGHNFPTVLLSPSSVPDFLILPDSLPDFVQTFIDLSSY